LGSSKLSTDDEATVFEGEYCLALKTGLMPPANEIEDWPAEILDRRLSPVVLTTELTMTPLSTEGTVEVLQNKIKQETQPQHV
jgi:hypothetical protein